MSQRDFYQVLGVERGAGEEEIKRAYRQKAMQYHPDRNPDDPEAEQKFKEAAEAYDVLRDPARRQNYDRFGTADPFGGGSSGGFSSTEDIFSQFSDIFGDLFGFGARTRNRPQQGQDLRYNLTISFEKAAKGAEVQISVPRQTVCDECGGSGARPGTSRETCSHCGGSGQLRHSQGFFQVSVPCGACGGVGQSIPHPCPKCRGKGEYMLQRELTVRIPAGVYDGARLRLRGEGESGLNGGPPGDLYVVLRVEEDKVFKRQGQDLVYTAVISFVDAALGTRIKVPGLNDELDLEVPKGTQPGAVLRLAGEGLPYPGERKTGNLLVEIKVKTPTKLNKEQERLLREFDQVSRAQEKTLSGKVKKTMENIGKAMGMDN